MEDDKIKALFADFRPDISSDLQFMARLERNLNSVEIIRRHVSEVRSRNKRAVAIAALAGFIVGFLFSLSLPYLVAIVSNWQLTLPPESMMNILANNFSLVAWIVIGGTSIFTALNAYEVSLSMMKTRDR